MPGFDGLNSEMCSHAFENFVRPIIRSTAEAQILNKYAGCAVVLDPFVTYSDTYKRAIEDGLFDELVLWQTAFGDPKVHEVHKYKRIAYAKAFTSFMTGLPSHQVQQVLPVLYAEGMTKWGGSAVAGIGPMRLIVAFSGVQWYFDQMISEMMISALTALCHAEVAELMKSDEPMILPAR